ncbi:MAG TPA: TolC family protein [Ferrovaceae bacterium]|uniref:TolC family protein n=1 Tax=Ferrovum sp. JA12 TaxID=1356299 RepID=UPI000AD6D49A|nr:TolC family protein [Ferrovum sp. JA12]HQT80840.1 TolC family protein [Ferrovaceae bacterium]HQU06580.1 TolC family protein [Ferrovaceae bacterium]
MSYKKVIFFLLLILWNHTVHAQNSLSLTLEEAMAMAVANHTQSQMARSLIDESMANQRLQQAQLLPNLSLSAYQLRESVNLRAQGFNLQGFPVLIGPFNSFASSVNLSQKVFDLSLWNNLKASQWITQETELKAQSTFQQVAANAAYAYINLLRARAELKTAEANYHLAEELETLSTDQKKQGISTGVDVVRAQTQTTQYQYDLRAMESLVDDSQTKLKRALGIDLDTPIIQTETLTTLNTPIPDLAESILDAKQSRPELLASKALMSARESVLQAKKDAFLPSVEVRGAVGPSGVTPVINDYHVYSVGVFLSMPLWNGGATQAEENIAFSELHQAKLQLADIEAQVDEDVRIAYNALRTTHDEVIHAQKNLQLATTLMNQSGDRYRNGVADNLEVVNAQTTIAQARSQLDNALASEHIAWINFDLARGKIRYSEHDTGQSNHE